MSEFARYRFSGRSWIQRKPDAAAKRAATRGPGEHDVDELPKATKEAVK